MTRTEFIFQVSEQTGMTKKDTERTIRAAFETLSQLLAAGDQLQIARFGTFKTRLRPSLNGRHPATGAPLVIEETRVPVFEPSQKLKERVKENHAAG